MRVLDNQYPLKYSLLRRAYKMSLLPTCLVFSVFFLVGSSADECQCIENLIYLPVCGDDGRTYVSPSAVHCYNQCNKANVKVLRREPCTCNCATNKSLLPVCGTDGRSYVNPSAVDCHNKCNYPPIKIVGDAPCHDDDDLLQN